MVCAYSKITIKIYRNRCIHSLLQIYTAFTFISCFILTLSRSNQPLTPHLIIFLSNVKDFLKKYYTEWGTLYHYL